MAETHALTDSGVTAAASLTSNQYQGVKLTASRTVNLVAASTDIPYGILMNKPQSGQACEVCIAGIGKVQVGAALAADTEVMFNGSAVAVAATTGNRVIGLLLEASNASGDVVAIKVYPTPYVHA
jgi:hypothetical protein